MLLLQKEVTQMFFAHPNNELLHPGTSIPLLTISDRKCMDMPKESGSGVVTFKQD